jgi:hypothetical protein
MTGLSSLKPRICRKYLLNVLQIIENRNCSRELYGKEGLISSYLEATGSIETAVDIHRLLVLSFPGNKIYLPIQKVTLTEIQIVKWSGVQIGYMEGQFSGVVIIK